jgi:hypothetical protein
MTLFSLVDGGSYKALLAIHILAAVIWVGGGMMITMQAERARQARNDQEFVSVALQAEFWGTRVFIPTSLVLVACGFGMIGVGHIGFSHPFIDIGLTGWVISFVIGAGFLGPQSVKLKELLTTEGAITPVVKAHVARILWVARVDLVILFAVIVAMVAKPGGGA